MARGLEEAGGWLAAKARLGWGNPMHFRGLACRGYPAIVFLVSGDSLASSYIQ